MSRRRKSLALQRIEYAFNRMEAAGARRLSITGVQLWGDRFCNLLLTEAKTRRGPLIELKAVPADGIHAVSFQFQQHASNNRCCLAIRFKKSLFAVLDDLHGFARQVGSRKQVSWLGNIRLKKRTVKNELLPSMMLNLFVVNFMRNKSAREIDTKCPAT